MKILIVISILLIITGVTLASSTGASGTWMVQAGLILLLGALTVFTGRRKLFAKDPILLKYAEWGSFAVMAFLFILGFLSDVWSVHPLGAIIALAGSLWVVKEFSSDNPNSEHEREERIKELTSENTNQKMGLEKIKKWSEVYPFVKWLGVPLGILLVLWLSKSILIAFVVGFGIVAFLDKQSIQVKGLNRVTMLLILYAVGFCLLIIGTFKITDPYAGIFYNIGDVFFDLDSYIFLRDITRGL
ncbi:MAG: hypothetical protein NUV61_03530 [Candidatus Azambacteria bacterium]|nr:hypothetical protein [Candidatus Azambacteria bacterium]